MEIVKGPLFQFSQKRCLSSPEVRVPNCCQGGLKSFGYISLFVEVVNKNWWSHFQERAEGQNEGNDEEGQGVIKPSWNWRQGASGEGVRVRKPVLSMGYGIRL